MVDALSRLFGKGSKKSALSNSSSGQTLYGGSFGEVESDNGFTVIGPAVGNSDTEKSRSAPSKDTNSKAPHMLDGVEFSLSSLAKVSKERLPDSRELEYISQKIEHMTASSSFDYSFNLEKSIIDTV